MAYKPFNNLTMKQYLNNLLDRIKALKVKDFFDAMKRLRIVKIGFTTLWMVSMLIIGLFMFYVLVFVTGPFGSYSRFPSTMLLIYIGILALMFMDRIYHHNIDTTKAIQQNNTAYALLMVAYSIIIAAVIVTV